MSVELRVIQEKYKFKFKPKFTLSEVRKILFSLALAPTTRNTSASRGLDSTALGLPAIVLPSGE